MGAGARGSARPRHEIAVACTPHVDGGCPCCSGHRVLAGYDGLVTAHSEAIAMWRPRMNRGLKPADVISTSGRKVWAWSL